MPNKQTSISQDRHLAEPTVTQYPSACPFPLPSLLIWGLTMLQSCQSTQGSPKGCTFPLCAKLGEKVWEKESWSHWATPFPSKSAGRQGKSRQGRDIPSCPLQPTTPRTVWPWDSERTLRLVAQHPLPPSYPPMAQGEKEQEGWAFSCQCPAGAVSPGVRNSPVSPGNCQGFQGRNLVQLLRHKWYK